MAVAYYLKDKTNLNKWVIVLDVFRSSNTIISILDRGAIALVPTISVSDAMQLKELHPDWLLFGERNGVMIDGFDGDSSPAQLSPDVAGKVVILTTSGGTRCINSCDNTRQVIIASFANANAVIDYLHSEKISDPTFWAVGVRGDHCAKEDDVCANYLDNLHKGQLQDFTKIHHELFLTSGSQRLLKLGQDNDLDYCTSLNISTTVPQRIMLEDGSYVIGRRGDHIAFLD